MHQLNNIDFSKLEHTCTLPEQDRSKLWDATGKVAADASFSSYVVAAFELGASLAHQQEQKKVCMLCKPF